MTVPMFNKDAVKAALTDQAETLFRAAWGEPIRAAGKEWRAKNNNALSMAMQGHKRGVWHDHKSGGGGDALTFYAVQMLGLSSVPKGAAFKAFLSDAAAWAGLSPDIVPDRAKIAKAQEERERAAQIEAEREAAERAALIRLLRDRAQDATGTPAEAYLARRGVSTFSRDTVAYCPPLPFTKGLLHGEAPALIVWAKDNEGNTTGGQRILITQEGDKAALDPRKPSFGSIQGTPARFPAQTKGGPLYIAEGPESALSVWIATGCETWAVFGVSGWKAAPLPPGRQVILCPDRDALGSPAQIAFSEAVKHHAAHQWVNLWIAEAPEPEGSKDDLNDTLQRAGIEAVKAALDAAKPVSARAKAMDQHRAVVDGFFRDALPISKAVRQVKRETATLDKEAPDYQAQRKRVKAAAQITHGLSVTPSKTFTKALNAPRVMLSGAQGIGKTRALIAGLSEAVGIVSLSVFPTHEKVREAFEDYAEAFERSGRAGPIPLHLKGRNARDTSKPKGVQMCLVPKAANKLAQKGINVRGTLCERCPFADTCGYLKQEAELKGLSEGPQGVAIFAPHDYAFLPLPAGVTADLIAFDEGANGQGAELHNITFDALGAGLTYGGNARIRNRIKEQEARADALADELQIIKPLMIAVRNAFEGNPAEAYADLIGAGYDAAKVKEAVAALSQFEETNAAQKIEAARDAGAVDALALDKRIDRALDDQEAKVTRVLRHVFQTIADELDAGLAQPTGLTVGHDTKKRRALYVSRLRETTFPEHAPFLHLDGTGDADLAGAVFGQMRVEHHPVERPANITQVIGNGFSNQSIKGAMSNGQSFTGKRAEEAAQMRRDLIAFASRTGGLVMGNKGVIDALRKDGLENPYTHFGNIRGRNDWESLNACILIGREQPSPEAVERIARAFASKLGQPFQSIAGTQYPEEPRRLKMQDGTAQAVEVAHHPDPWGERILKQIRDAEALQAIDRIRPHFKDAPVTVYILSPVCLDVTVDKTCTWAELKAGGSRIDRARNAGVIPLSGREAARMYPDLWTVSSADRDLSDLSKAVESLMSQNPNSIYYLENGTLSGMSLVMYKTPAKQGGGRVSRWHKALVWGRPDEARAKVEKLSGPLAAFEVVPEWLPVMDRLDELEYIARRMVQDDKQDAPAEAPEGGTEGQAVQYGEGVALLHEWRLRGAENGPSVQRKIRGGDGPP